MRIGEAAAITGLEASAIRFYEQQGVLPTPRRTRSGYRSYDDADVELLGFVKRARSLEIPLDDIRQIVELRNGGQAPCAVVRTVIAREAATIETRIAALEDLRRELFRLQELAEEVVDDWPDGACVCHIVESNVSAH
jgi:DNA-binding transcriptional MerR regulator